MVPSGEDTFIPYNDSHRSFNPSLSVSARCGSVPNSASCSFVRPSRSGSPYFPCSGSGHESLSLEISASSAVVVEPVSSSRVSDSPLSRGFNPCSTSQPSLMPSLSVSGSSGLVPYCDSRTSGRPSSSRSVASPEDTSSPNRLSSAALSNSPIPSEVW